MRQKTRAELRRPSAAFAKTQERAPVTLVLENIRSGANVGVVLRTADAFALAEVILVGYTPQPPHREILKTSLGAEASVPWRHFGTIQEAVKALRQNGSRVMALEQTTESVPVDAVDWVPLPSQVLASEGTSSPSRSIPTPPTPPHIPPPSSRAQPRDPSSPLAIVLGNEVRGVTQEALDLCDGALEIPQFGIKHSLNVSVAAGIVAYLATASRGSESAQ